MTLSDDRRAAWLDGMAQHVLTHGLTHASLRPLAQAVGTSDRMLIYHFGSKEGVVGALLRDPGMEGYGRVWLDILSAAAGGSAAHREAGQEIMAGFAGWLEGRLPEGTDEPAAVAATLLTLIEGVIVMDSVGQSALADRAVAVVGMRLS